MPIRHSHGQEFYRNNQCLPFTLGIAGCRHQQEQAGNDLGVLWILEDPNPRSFSPKKKKCSISHRAGCGKECSVWGRTRGSAQLDGKNIPDGFFFCFMQEYSLGRLVEELKGQLRAGIKGEMSQFPTQCSFLLQKIPREREPEPCFPKMGECWDCGARERRNSQEFSP